MITSSAKSFARGLGFSGMMLARADVSTLRRIGRGGDGNGWECPDSRNAPCASDLKSNGQNLRELLRVDDHSIKLQ
jgi:hypothetical protein